MKVIRLFFLNIMLLTSCKTYTEQGMIGQYVPVNYHNNYDTIQLEQNGIYKRKVYDINKNLLLNMNGEWEIHGDAIKFQPFYLNLDDDLVKYPESIDTSGGWGGYLWSKSGTTEFCVGYFSADLPDQNCYRKIK